MYAQGGQGEAQPQGETAQGDNVEDVESEEVIS
jgi:molecular chaperone DnaK